MNKRNAKKHNKFISLQEKYTLYGLIPKGWSEIRWAKQIVKGILKVR